MSISLLNTSYGTGSGTSFSFSHNAPSGTNLIVAFLCTRGSGAYITSQTCKWMDSPGGSSFTFLSYKDHSTTFYLTVSLFYIFPVNTGTNNITLSWSTTANAIAGAFSMSGADTPDVTSIQSTGGTGTPMQRDISSAAGDLVLAGISMEGNTDDTLTPVSGVTESWNQKSTNVFGAGGYIAGASPTATIGWNIGNRACFLAVNVPATPPPDSPFLPRINFM